MPTQERLTLTVREAADLIGVSRWTLYRQINEGRFPPALKIGQTWRVSTEALREYVRSGWGGREEG